MKNVLLLGSQSISRQQLLRDSRIPFQVIPHTVHEEIKENNLSFEEKVLLIAEQKMNCIMKIIGKDEAVQFILTADTLGKDSTGRIWGKPRTRDEARNMLTCLRGGGTVCTAFHLIKRVLIHNGWNIEHSIKECVQAHYVLDIPDHWIEKYLDVVPYQQISGGLTVDDYGAQFVAHITGSYTAILGLPLYEVRKALETAEFFNS